MSTKARGSKKGPAADNAAGGGKAAKKQVKTCKREQTLAIMFGGICATSFSGFSDRLTG